MKRLRKLTRTEKEICSNHYLKADEWAFVSESEFYLTVQNKVTGQRKILDKHRTRRD